ncbi:MAG: AbrB/MazE/SpoVT family DNA-binding domain-containing protein [Acidobacteria bacterium]|nr:AbrB/MazE/SpoVT family DNA-binding domain-containing protein [Acidobacteriota bacterium]MBI3657282.1 AbrB/MazE/SpoVT family DNA-binding domain-containing protein [Acidobacteriota bacterium]
MVSKVQKWGNSQGLRLPKHVLESADISVGDAVEVIPQERQILIKKVSQRKFDLAEMVSRMPRTYNAREESFGKPAGREEW